jgi:hypothetical protein
MTLLVDTGSSLKCCADLSARRFRQRHFPWFRCARSRFYLRTGVTVRGGGEDYSKLFHSVLGVVPGKGK